MPSTLASRSPSNVALDDLQDEGIVIAKPAIDRERAVASFFRGPLILHSLMLLVTFGVWLPVLLIWALGFGQWYSRRRAEELDYRLMSGRLLIKDGVFTKVRKTIPLDKVTDIALSQGIIDRWLGLWRVSIQTASSGAAAPEAVAYGLADPMKFRREVLAQRDQWMESGEPAPAALPVASSALADREVSEKLGRIEVLLAKIAENTGDVS